MTATRPTVDVSDLVAALDLVRAAEVARRCGVARSTVMRWQRPWARAAGGPLRLSEPTLPPPHVIIGGVDYWSWPMLTRLDPDRFPEGVS